MPLPKIFLQGNLVAEPDLRFAASGKAICKMRVASSESRKNDAGGWDDGPTAFLDLTTFDKVAEECAEQLHKGSAVVVHGRLKQREWQDDSGQKRQAYEVLVEAIGPQLRAKKGQARRPQDDGDPWAAGTSAGPAGGSVPDDEPPF